MSFCSAIHPTVTSSSLLRSVTTKLPRRTACPLSLRSFSAYGSSNHSSKRKLQTATAYQPYSLPESFPPPRNTSGVSESSITVENATLSKWQSKSTGQPQQPPRSDESIKDSSASSPASSPPEAEAQKANPIASSSLPSTLASTAPSTLAKSEPPKKPRRASRLKARKTAMHITPEAILHLRQLTDQPDPKLVRVGVKNRGCSGLSYNLEYVDKPAPFDEVVEQDGVKILIDSKALFSIIGTEMDWQEDSLASRFVFRNPNITLPLANASKNYLLKTMVQHSPLLPSDISLLLTIRFSASIRDILLEIPDPTHLTAAGLKQLIRERLPQDLSTRRLRLIHAGKALEDGSSLSSALNIVSLHERDNKSTTTPFPPGGADSNFDHAGDGGRGSGNGTSKGKAPVRDPPTPRLRTYIHCSIGDIILSAPELEAEARLARVAEKTNEKREGKGMVVDRHSSSSYSSSPFPSSHLELSSTSNILLSPSAISATAPRNDTSHTPSPSPSGEHGGPQQAESSSSNSNHRPIPPVGPRGFDRLLEAGFTPAEVSALRSQFLALQSLSHTPDTMPSGAELRRLEDIWMDEGGSTGSMDGGGGGLGVGALAWLVVVVQGLPMTGSGLRRGLRGRG
ncbi:hypothetical protein ACJ72_01978 [Emergomyces africanus]|uniref:Ubiquitin-like domain-containing protein n=1 Tax=Emergomyces africanus TaxID=1955775 RepID=A0A1B7P3R0_9EURO|nr:hypothetical protein ACJ72_01978 [Emergomyces africanus]